MDGILWPRSGSNSEVSKACDLAGSLFRQGTVTTRTCSETGDWSDVDLSTCTLIIDSPPFLLLSFVLGLEELCSVEDTSELEAEVNFYNNDVIIILTQTSICLLSTDG